MSRADFEAVSEETAETSERALKRASENERGAFSLGTLSSVSSYKHTVATRVLSEHGNAKGGIFMDLKGKTILLTGGRRVGQVVADELGGVGANILMTYRKSREEIAQAVDHLTAIHRIRAGAYPLDLTDEGSIRTLVKDVTADFGGIDGLVNMAAVFAPDPKEITAPHVLTAFSVTIGSMLLSRWFAEDAKRRKATNVPIVSFIDWAVDHPYAGYDLYFASKAALRHYLMALQTSFAGTIRVVNIHPGMILGPPDLPAAEKQAIIKNTPTLGIGDPQQAAKLVRTALETDFLADNVFLDGGQHWRHRL